MNAKLLISLIAATLSSLSVYAHDCSGGADGGMDATGNQCNNVATAATVSSDGAFSSRRVPKVELNKSATCTKCGQAHRRNATSLPRTGALSSAETVKETNRLARVR